MLTKLSPTDKCLMKSARTYLARIEKSILLEKTHLDVREGLFVRFRIGVEVGSVNSSALRRGLWEVSADLHVKHYLLDTVVELYLFIVLVLFCTSIK